MTQRKLEPFQQQAEQRLQAEAMRIAKSTQVHGQDKEQTKLIAKGIEKGLALYKRQQKAKARERDKARKKVLNRQPQSADDHTGGEAASADREARAPSMLWALIVSGVSFALSAIVHFARYALGWDMAVGPYAVPLAWSAVIALLAATLAIWILRLAWIHR